METNKNEISDDEAGRDYTSHDLFRVYELVNPEEGKPFVQNATLYSIMITQRNTRKYVIPFCLVVETSQSTNAQTSISLSSLSAFVGRSVGPSIRRSVRNANFRLAKKG